jgi:hypothetical protein
MQSNLYEYRAHRLGLYVTHVIELDWPRKELSMGLLAEMSRIIRLAMCGRFRITRHSVMRSFADVGDDCSEPVLCCRQSKRERSDIQELSNAKDDAVELRPDFEHDIEDIVHILKCCGPPSPWNQSKFSRKNRALSTWNGITSISHIPFHSTWNGMWEIRGWYIRLKDVLNVQAVRSSV